jgi:hypothetical protein
MGAGASICDEEDLIKEFDKERSSLPANAVEELEALYNDPAVQKKGEFYVIGKCRKRFGELQSQGDKAPVKEVKMDSVLGVAANNNPNGFLNREMMGAVEIDDGANLDQQLGQNLTKFLPAPGPDAYQVKGPKPFPSPAVGFKCKAGPNPIVIVKLEELDGALSAAKLANLTPLVIDRSASHAIDSFFQYKGTVIDAKAMSLDVTIRNKSYEEVMEKQRCVLALSIMHGKTCVVACSGAAPDFMGTFNDTALAASSALDLSGKPFASATATDKSVFPLELFDSCGACLLEPATAEKLMREENVTDHGGQAKIDAKFNVVVTTHFRCLDLDDHFFSGDAPRLPPGKFQPIWIQHEDGTDVME